MSLRRIQLEGQPACPVCARQPVQLSGTWRDNGGGPWVSVYCQTCWLPCREARGEAPGVGKGETAEAAKAMWALMVAAFVLGRQLRVERDESP